MIKVNGNVLVVLGIVALLLALGLRTAGYDPVGNTAGTVATVAFIAWILEALIGLVGSREASVKREKSQESHTGKPLVLGLVGALVGLGLWWAGYDKSGTVLVTVMTIVFIVMMVHPRIRHSSQ